MEQQISESDKSIRSENWFSFFCDGFDKKKVFCAEYWMKLFLLNILLVRLRTFVMVNVVEFGLYILLNFSCLYPKNATVSKNSNFNGFLKFKF